MSNYSILPHMADVRLHVRGDTVEELFAHALEGMNRIMNEQYEKECVNGKKVSLSLALQASEYTSLLVDFLSAVLTESSIQRAIFHTVDTLVIEDGKLYQNKEIST